MSKIRASLKSRSGGNKGSGSNLASRGEDDEKKRGDDEEKRPKKKEKTKRVWAGENAKGKTEGLDFSEGKPPGAGDEEVERVDISKPSRVDAEEEEEYSSEEEEEEDTVATSSSDARSPSKPKNTSLRSHSSY